MRVGGGGGATGGAGAVGCLIGGGGREGGIGAGGAAGGSTGVEIELTESDCPCVGRRGGGGTGGFFRGAGAGGGGPLSFFPLPEEVGFDCASRTKPLMKSMFSAMSERSMPCFSSCSMSASHDGSTLSEMNPFSASYPMCETCRNEPCCGPDMRDLSIFPPAAFFVFFLLVPALALPVRMHQTWLNSNILNRQEVITKAGSDMTEL